MQVTSQRLEPITRRVGRLVRDGRMEVAILNALSDEASRKMLNSTTAKARSVEELANEISVPMSTAYRLVNDISEAILLFVDRLVVTEEMKRYATYRSALGEIKVAMDAGGVRVWVSPNERIID